MTKSNNALQHMATKVTGNRARLSTVSDEMKTKVRFEMKSKVRFEMKRKVRFEMKRKIRFGLAGLTGSRRAWKRVMSAGM